MSKKKTDKKVNIIDLDVKTHVVDLDGIKFHIRPQAYADITDTWKWVDGVGLSLESENPIESISIDGYAFIRRIEKWQGIHINGKKAECTMENKMLLFGRRPDLLFTLVRKYSELVEADLKN